MNRYLVKIAAFVQSTDQSLPYRRRVEVAIFKGDKVLLTKNKTDEGKAWYGFPGGGTEGETDASAAEKECLEEVGVKVKDLKKTDVLHKQEGISAKKGREKKYRGSVTRVFTATFDSKDNSKLGDDGDSVKYGWFGISEAKKLLKENDLDSSYRIQAISKTSV